MLKYLLLFATAAVLALLTTPLIRFAADKLKIFDHPAERKVHKAPVPLLGGIPIFIAFNLTIILGGMLNLGQLGQLYASKWMSLLIVQVVILALGIFDDIKNLKPVYKLLIQFSAGILMVLFGFGIKFINNPFTGDPIRLGLLSIPITVLWIVIITNALNLIDGLDGLASGVALITSVTVFGIAFFYQNLEVSFLSIILAGSILGFLRYNFHPAKIFLGDSGSLLLGFLLAVLSLEGSHKGAVIVTVLAPILALGLPILEVMLSTLRRFIRPSLASSSLNNNSNAKNLFFRGASILQADKDHIHHRLLKRGFSQQKVLFTLYGITLLLCVLAIVTVSIQNLNITLFLAAILIALIIGVRSLKYPEFKITGKDILTSLFNLPTMSKKFFQAILDLSFITIAYTLSFIITLGSFGPENRALFFKTWPLVLTVKICFFYLTHLYRGSWRFSRIEDFIKIITAVVLSSAGVIALLVLLYGSRTFGGILFFFTDFYIVLTLVGGSRIMVRILEFYLNRDKPAK